MKTVHKAQRQVKTGKSEKPIKTLIVDDSPRAQRAVAYVLENEGGFELVGVARDGRDALKQVEALKPDLVLMDIQMPEMNGFEATTRVRKQFPRTRVIMITLHDGPEIGLACEQSGAHGYLPKSRLHQRLSAEIRRVFRE